MKANSKTIFGSLLRWRAQFQWSCFTRPDKRKITVRRNSSAPTNGTACKTLATSHELVKKSAPDQLLTRLSDNEGVLLECSRVLTATVSANRRLTPAGEWLLDNFYLIDEQIRTAKRHLPKGYSRELPRLLNGPSAGLPAFMTLRWRRLRTAMDG